MAKSKTRPIQSQRSTPEDAPRKVRAYVGGFGLLPSKSIGLEIVPTTGMMQELPPLPVRNTGDGCRLRAFRNPCWMSFGRLCPVTVRTNRGGDPSITVFDANCAALATQVPTSPGGRMCNNRRHSAAAFALNLGAPGLRRLSVCFAGAVGESRRVAA